MLPNRAGTYELYKADTDAIANWLANTARRCGYPPDLLAQQGVKKSDTSQQTPRLKGKARKLEKLAREAATKPNGDAEAQETAKPALPTYIVAVKDFVALVTCIGTYKKQHVKVPSEVAKSLDRAIALRKSYAEWYQAAGNADEGHTYFIGVLEQVRENLKNCMPSPVVGRQATKSGSKPNAQETDCSRIDTLFNHLELEEPSDASMHAPLLSNTIKSSSQNDHDAARYLAERLRTTQEQNFAVSCVLSDVANIHTTIKEVWTKYHEGKIDLQAASITTNIAVEIVRQKEEDFDKTFPDNDGFHVLVNHFWQSHRCAGKEEPNKDVMKEMLLSTQNYDLAHDILLPAFKIIDTMQELMASWAEASHEVSVYRPGVSGYRDHSVPWSDKDPTEKFEEDRLVMLEILHPLVAAAVATPRMVGGDELLRGITEMPSNKLTPLWLAFAVQSFLDIQHIMGPDTDRAFSELQQEARRVVLMIGNGGLSHEHGPLRNVTPLDMKGLQTVKDWILTWLDNDTLGVAMERCAREKGGTVAVLGKDGGHALLKQYPVLCGVWLYKLRLTVNGVSINFTNAWGLLSPCAHLYNAMRQEKLLESDWDAMEDALELHKSDGIFIGDPPDKIKDYYNRLCLCIGFSAARFSRNLRANQFNEVRWSQKGPRLFSDKHLPLSKNVASRYFGETASRPSDFPAMQEYLSSPELRSKMPVLEPSSSVSQDSTFLNRLAAGLNNEVPAMTFDYFALQNACRDILDSIRDKMRSSIINEWKEHTESLKYLLFVALSLLMSASERAKRTKSKHSSELVASENFIEAAEIVEEMLSSGQI